MQQAQTQSVVQPVPAKTPVTPASKTAPLPLAPSLFRHVGGGDIAPPGPKSGW